MYSCYCGRAAALPWGGFLKFCTECRVIAKSISEEDVHNIFNKAAENKAAAELDGDEPLLEYHEYLEALMRVAALRYAVSGAAQLSLSSKLQGFVHNNIRFARGGSSLQNRDTKINS